MIIIDTREQKPIWIAQEPGMLRFVLDVADYTTTELINKSHIERKSGNDLYGSIIQGHERFRREIQRAKNKGIRLAVFVECPKEVFIGKKFKGGYRLQMKPAVLRKIVNTISDKYDIEFVWCKDRDDFKVQADKWFIKEKRFHGIVTTD